MASDFQNPTARGNQHLPIEQAVKSLEKNLQNLYALSKNAPFDLHTVQGSISKAIESLIKLNNATPRDSSLTLDVNSSMNHLRNALGALQSLCIEFPRLEEPSRAVAKTLALLYPLSKLKASHGHSTSSRSPTPAHIAERRNSQRIDVEAEVGFQSDTNFFMGFSEDISAGGLFISTFDTRPLGEVMNLNFTLPGGYLISVDGVVRWVREYNETAPETSPGMGVQFENLRQEDKAAIEEFINKRPAMFYDDE